MQIAVLERHFQRLRADVGQHQDLAAGEVLDDAGREPALIEFDFREHASIVERVAVYSMPRRSSRSSSRRQWRRTRTSRSRWALAPSSRSSERRAAIPISPILA